LALTALFLASRITEAQVPSPHSDFVSFATRSGIPPSSDGWVFERYSFDHQGGGIGASGITTMSASLQWQDCATPVPTQLAIFGQDLGSPARPILPGSPMSVADPSVVLIQSVPFTPPGGIGTCAYRYTIDLGSSPIPGLRIPDAFVGALLASSPTGTSSDAIHVHMASGSPLLNATPASRLEIDREFASTMLGGVIGTPGPNPATIAFPLPARIHHLWIGHEHVTRVGVQAPFAPDFGWPGDYPDAVNIAGTTPARRDELAWFGAHSTLGGANVVGSILLATRTLRDLPAPGLGAPISLGALGTLELDPGDPLLLATLRGAIAGLQRGGVNVGVVNYIPINGIQAQPGLPSLLHNLGVNLYAQELRFDLGTGVASLGSLDTHSFRR
jgi:hypothetical protein